MNPFLAFGLAGLLLFVGLPLAMIWDYRRAKNKSVQLVMIIVTAVAVTAIVTWVLVSIAALLP